MSTYYSVVSSPLCGRRGCVSLNATDGLQECEFLKGYQDGSRQQGEASEKPRTHTVVDRIEIQWVNKGTLSFRTIGTDGRSKTTATLPLEQGIPYIKTMLHAWLRVARKEHKDGGKDNLTKIYFSGALVKIPLAHAIIHLFEGPGRPPMGIDIQRLVNVRDLRVVADRDQDNILDIFACRVTPLWYRECPWFVPDDMSKRFEKQQGLPYLYTGKVPTPGQRIEICVYLPNGSWGRLSGSITKVLPAVQESAAVCSHYCCKKKPSSQKAVTWGAHFGQQVEGLVSLNFDFWYKQELVKFFRGEETKYKVVMWCHHCKVNVWEVLRVASIK